MPDFSEILASSEEELLQHFYKVRDDASLAKEDKLNAVGKKFALRGAQLVCAVGFNSNAQNLPEILPPMGFDSFDELARTRNDVFTSDIYKRVPFDNIIEIYTSIKDNPEMLQIMQYLLKSRLYNIEHRIEETVNTIIIEKYLSFLLRNLWQHSHAYCHRGLRNRLRRTGSHSPVLSWLNQR